MLKPSYELVVIGAGPAGLAAAAKAAELGVDTLLLDEQPSPGGQIYRAIADTPVKDRRILGPDYWKGESLLPALDKSGAAHLPGATVWCVSREREISVSIAGAAYLVNAERIILATGALERPMPIPGWTLPGVMTAGAAQILLKSAGLTAEGKVYLAGTGPLLWLVAWQYLRAGGQIAAILDTTPWENWKTALRYLPGFLGTDYFKKGLSLLWEVRRRIKVVSGVTALAAEGEGRLRQIRYRVAHGAERLAQADTLLLHQGIVPNVNLALSIGCEHDWDKVQLCWKPRLDEWGASTVEGIAIVGDGAGIGGAAIAVERGRLAALDAAFSLGKIDEGARARDAAPIRQAAANAARGRDFLDTFYRPTDAFRRPEGDTLVCRCEEVTAKQIVEAVGLGCTGPNQVKSFLRSGMGPCQGRLCGLTVTELIAAVRGVSPAAVGYYRLRPPVKPITLAELASLPKSEAAVKAVARH